MKRLINFTLSVLAYWTVTVDAQSAERLHFLLSWKAQAEHGGYYQALANGYYNQCGLDLNFRQGGPGVDPKQLLVGGAVDILMSTHNGTAIELVQAGFPAKAVMAGFQRDPMILIAHDGSGIQSFEDMKGKPIMISMGSRTTFWPFLRRKYGFADSQIRSFSGQIGPWLADESAIQQGFITTDPYLISKATGKSPKVFPLADSGYAAYSSVIIVPQKLIDTKPHLVQCFVDASKKGWKEFLGNPAPAVALIQKSNPANPDDVIANAIKVMKSERLVENDETRDLGIGAMTDQRWKVYTDMLADVGLTSKDFDVKKAYTLRFLETK